MEQHGEWSDVMLFDLPSEEPACAVAPPAPKARPTRRKTQLGETIPGGIALGAEAILIEQDLERFSKHPLNPRIIRPDDPKIIAIAEEIKTSGLYDPISVCADPERAGHFFIVDGARRHAGLVRLRLAGHAVAVRAVMIDGDPLEYLIAREATSRRFGDYERAVLWQSAVDASPESQNALAVRSGLSRTGFLKAMAPARLPDFVKHAISDLHNVRVSDADRALRNIKKNPEAVKRKLASLTGPFGAHVILDMCAWAGVERPEANNLPKHIVEMRNEAQSLVLLIPDALDDANVQKRLLKLVKGLAKLR